MIALGTLRTDVQVREERWSFMLDEVLKRYQAAMDQAMFLVSVEREKAMYNKPLLQREPSESNWKSEGVHVENRRRDQERL
jgi:hypothetical protein